MSHYLDDPLLDTTEDIDALNDETFGADAGDFTDDWEEEHEKLVGETGDSEPSSEFIDTGSIVQTANDSFNQYQFREHSFRINSVKSPSHHNRLNDDPFPNLCEDITKSVLDVVSDEDDDFLNSFSYDNDIQNRLFQNVKFDLKEKAKNIDLESLRPPSPSILPFDHTFMSSVWRPPSPPETNNLNTTSNSHHYSPPTITTKESPKTSPPLSIIDQTQNIFKALNLSSTIPTNKFNSPTQFIKAEDLEADLTQDTTKINTKSTSPNRQQSSTTMAFKNISPNITNSAYSNKTAPINLIELAAMQMGRMSNSPNAASIPQQQQATIISPKSAILQPPPGLGIPNNNNNKMMTSPNSMFVSKSPMNQFQMNNNAKYRSLMDKLPFLAMMNNGLVTPPKIPMPLPPQQPLPFPMQHFLDPMLQQQRITMNKIITPAQAQRSYNHLKNFFNKNQDKFAGFMTQKEKEWLLKIFRLQCKVNDPYVEDYYEVSYMLKKNSEKMIAKQIEMINFGQHEAASKLDTEPMLVLPQLAQVEEYKPKYIQFDNALGKIQVLNSKCPRKLVEFHVDDGDNDNGSASKKLFENYKLDLHSQYLLKIERVYEYFLNIEDENKRMPILPDNVKEEHRDKRRELCKKLFNGLISASNNKTNKKEEKESQFFILINRTMLTLKKNTTQIDPEIMKIDKGFFLVLRSLFQLEEEDHLIVLCGTLLKNENYNRISIIEQKFKVNLRIAILKAISKIQNAKALIYIVSQIDDASIFNDDMFGSNLLINLFKQYQQSDDKLLFIYFWKLFVQTLLQKLPETVTSHQICKEHLVYLNQL